MELELIISLDADRTQAESEAEAAKAHAEAVASHRQLCHTAFLQKAIAEGKRELATLKASVENPEALASYRPYSPQQKATIAGLHEALEALGVDCDEFCQSAPTLDEHKELLALGAKHPERRDLFARAFRGQSEFEHHASVLRALREHDRLVTEEAPKE